VIGWICLGWNSSFVHALIYSCVSISGLHCVTRYVVWLFRCMWPCISITSYEVWIVSLGVMYVSPMYVAPCFLVVPLSRLMCVVRVSYVVGLASGRA